MNEIMDANTLFRKWEHRDRLNNRKWQHTIYPWMKRECYLLLPPSLRIELERRVAFHGTFRFNLRYRSTHPWTAFQDIYYEIKAFAQRGFYGFAEADVYNFDTYLASILPHILDRMSGKANYSVCYEAMKQAAESLGYSIDTHWMAGDTVDQQESDQVVDLGIEIEDGWYKEFATAFRDYYTLMTGFNKNQSFQEQRDEMARIKVSMHRMIDYFEELNT